MGTIQPVRPSVTIHLPASRWKDNSSPPGDNTIIAARASSSKSNNRDTGGEGTDFTRTYQYVSKDKADKTQSARNVFGRIALRLREKTGYPTKIGISLVDRKCYFCPKIRKYEELDFYQRLERFLSAFRLWRFRQL
jgi:hypothetical protein